MDMVDGELVAAVKSREALRFEFVDEQRWDASCGYAALATLVHRYRGAAVDEASLLKLSVPKDGQAVLKVSLAELARLAQTLGFQAQGWRLGYENLVAVVQTSSPLLVHYDRPRGHFALVLTASAEGLVTADPARGLELLTRQQFLDRWSGVVLEVLDPSRPGLGSVAVEKAVKSARGRASLIDRALASRP